MYGICKQQVCALLLFWDRCVCMDVVFVRSGLFDRFVFTSPLHIVCGTMIPCFVPGFLMATPTDPSTMSPASGASSPAAAVAVSVGGSCSSMPMAPATGSRKRPSFKQRVLMFIPKGELSTAAMQEVVHISSTVSATIFSPTPLHAPAPVEADALDINGTPFTVDAPSSGGSNNFHSFHEQSDTQLLPTSHEPPTKKPKISKRRYL
jgi:hypothetical protein